MSRWSPTQASRRVVAIGISRIHLGARGKISMRTILPSPCWDAFISGVVALAITTALMSVGGNCCAASHCCNSRSDRRGCVRRRSVAPGLVASVETVDIGEREIGEDLRIFAAGVAVMAIDQDRSGLRGCAENGGQVGRRHMESAIDVGLVEGAGIANVEHDEVAACEQGLGALDVDTLERSAGSHVDVPPGVRIRLSG